MPRQPMLQQPKACPLNEETAEEEPKSVEDQAKDELKKKLKGLFD